MKTKLICAALLVSGTAIVQPATAAFLTASGPFSHFSCSGTTTITCHDTVDSVTSNASGDFADVGNFSFDAGTNFVITGLEILIAGTSTADFAIDFLGSGTIGGNSYNFNKVSTSNYAGGGDWQFGPDQLFLSPVPGASQTATLNLIGDGKSTMSDLIENNLEFVATVQAVPEPAEWMLLAIGVGAIGALRRRRDFLAS